MKIAITGHSSGIGKAIHDGFVKQGHEIIGYDLLTKHNVSTEHNVRMLAQDAVDCDMIVINAYRGFSQTTLLYEMFALWKNQSKTIVVIGSRVDNSFGQYPHEYAVHKATLDLAIKQLRDTPASGPKIINLKPGWVDTPLVKHVPVAPKMDPSDVFEILDWCLAHKNSILEITFESKY
jgi:NAD(P)-dependent dehydrogenase (short-subunit alcohol dehydrogenase family)